MRDIYEWVMRHSTVILLDKDGGHYHKWFFLTACRSRHHMWLEIFGTKYWCVWIS